MQKQREFWATWESRGSNLPSVFITGSSRGIGLEVASYFAKLGWTVGVHGSEPASVEAVSGLLGESAQTFAFDIRDSSALSNALMAFSKSVGGLDAVVHSAGIMKDAPLGMISEELISEVLEVNTVAALNVVQLSSRMMSRAKNGSIILINSVVGLDGAKGQSLYSLSKSALSGLVSSAAKELGPRGIRVNAIAPGLIQTDLIAGIKPETLEVQLSRVALGRLGTPADISPLVEYLASDRSSYLTGQTIRIDGGYSV